MFIRQQKNKEKMNYYNSISSGYDELHKEEQLKKLKIIKENITVKDSLLDVGCGTGFSLDLFDVPKKIGLDPSRELLKQCKHKAIVGKAEELPFEDDSFDTVISVTAVQNFDDIEKGLKEIKRVAKRQVVVSVLKKSEKAELVDKLVNSIFDVWKTIEEDKDIIYFCEV
jgi:ubiquinone/menaquinone biosynthesis C-methylase UbiE